MNLRAGTTGTCIAHFPEIIVLITIDDVIGRHVLSPVFGSLVIARNVLFGRTLEHGDIQILWVQFQHINQIFPCHINGALLEIITKAPVAQHLEHRVVIGVVAYLFQVIMLAANAQTLLCIGSATWFWVACSQDNIFPLVHAGVGKHQRRVVLDNHRSRGHDGVLL